MLVMDGSLLPSPGQWLFWQTPLGTRIGSKTWVYSTFIPPIFCSCFLLGVHFAGIFQVNYRKARVLKGSSVPLGLGLLDKVRITLMLARPFLRLSFWLKLGRGVFGW